MLTLEGARKRFAAAGGVPPRDPGADRQGARPDRRARLCRLLPDDVGDRPLLPPGGNPVPGPGLGRELRGVLLPRDHRGRPDAGGPAVRAVPVARAARAPRHRPRHHACAARGGDPARLRQVRPRSRRHGGERRALSCTVRGARGREGARSLRDCGRSSRQAAVASCPARCGGARACRARSGLSASRSPRQAVRADPGLPAGISRSIRAAFSSATSRFTTWCRSRTRRCPAAP